MPFPLFTVTVTTPLTTDVLVMATPTAEIAAAAGIALIRQRRQLASWVTASAEVAT